MQEVLATLLHFPHVTNRIKKCSARHGDIKFKPYKPISKMASFVILWTDTIEI